MKADYLDVSYKNVKLSSSLFAFSILFMLLVKPMLERTSFKSLNDLFIAIPILASGVISIIGFIYALKGSQYGKRNPKKRFFGLFGNFIFGFILIMLIIAIVSDFGVIMPMKK